MKLKWLFISIFLSSNLRGIRLISTSARRFVFDLPVIVLLRLMKIKWLPTFHISQSVQVCVASNLAYQPSHPNRLTMECVLMLDEVTVVQKSHISHSVRVCVASQLASQPADPTVECRCLMKLQWLITSLNSLILSPDLRGNSYLSQPADPFPTDHASFPWSAFLSLFFFSSHSQYYGVKGIISSHSCIAFSFKGRRWSYWRSFRLMLCLLACCFLIWWSFEI